ncbi:unnamed protein product [Moneuplotes crassus]|uniref:Uncharacterized protein n=1 Tax=Euplotes crassus TaxID=5936 RepID=A0AAD1XI92_EUPCR|nr:unnamed protein product [Moneuplotes crassus]
MKRARRVRSPQQKRKHINIILKNIGNYNLHSYYGCKSYYNSPQRVIKSPKRRVRPSTSHKIAKKQTVKGIITKLKYKNRVTKRNSKVNLNRYVKSSTSKSRENFHRSGKGNRLNLTSTNILSKQLTNSFSNKKITVGDLNSFLNFGNTEDSFNDCLSEGRSPNRTRICDEITLFSNRKNQSIPKIQSNADEILKKEQICKRKKKITGDHNININLKLKFNPMVLLNNGYKHYRYIHFSKR